MKKQTLITVLKETAETLRTIKFNPYHDSLGRFGTGGSGPKLAPDTGGGTGGGDTYEAKLSEWRKSLTSEEMDSIGEYTGPTFKKIRSCQNEGKGCNEKITSHMGNLSKALERAPKFEGEVYRGVAFTSKKKLVEFVAAVQKEGFLVEKGFTSTSSSKSIASKFTKKQKTSSFEAGLQQEKSVLIKLKSKTGVDISAVSSYPKEKEVLIKPPSKWKLNKVSSTSIPSVVGGKMVVLEMEEV
jgi:hypothetical protein